MLDLLNSLLHAPVCVADDRVLWHDLKHSSQTRLSGLRAEVAALQQRVTQHPASSWLLYSEDPQRFLVGLLALLASGRQVVICANRKPEWLGLLAGKFDAILSDELLVASAGEKELASVPLLNFDGLTGGAGDWRQELSGNEQLVFYTSGSTGQPKAVYKTLRALTNEIDTLRGVFGPRLDGHVFVSSVSHLHIYGLLFRILLPLAVHGSGVLQQVEFPEQLLLFRARLAESFAQPALVFVSSPAFLGRLDTSLPPVVMDAVFSSGGPLPYPDARECAGYFSSTPVEVYGSTETGGIGYRQQHVDAVPWTPFPGMQLSVMEAGTALLSPHMPGLPVYELDDNLEILADGRFILKGRKDRIVKIAEKRVSLTEIENFLQGLEGVQQCIALPLLLHRELVACAVVLTPVGRKALAEQGERALINAWKQAMRSRFENVVIPRRWQILPEIPLNSQSKIDHDRLLAGFTAKAN